MKTLISQKIALVVLLSMLLLVANPVYAKNPDWHLIDNMYVVELIDPPLVYFDGENDLLSVKSGKNTLRATSPRATGVKRLDVYTKDAVLYSRFLDERFESFQAQFQNQTGIKIEAKFRYRSLMNGFAAEMDAATAEQIRNMPEVKSVIQDYKHYLHATEAKPRYQSLINGSAVQKGSVTVEKVQVTPVGKQVIKGDEQPLQGNGLDPEWYAGPEWIGARKVWEGVGALPETSGEGVIVGIIDTGINADHPSFAATGEDGYTHTNPLTSYLGQCDQSGVNCNDKLIGVYNFTDDDSNGIDFQGHGSHVASIAVGNVLNNKLLNIVGKEFSYDISGVAPHSNLISYKVCREDDASTLDEDETGCQVSAITAALDQAVGDGVDVINYSMGSASQPSPWSDPISVQFLALRAAGVFVVTGPGNEGDILSILSPANSPWITAVASATHDEVVGFLLADMSGGDTAAPVDMVGASFSGAGLSMSDIVYAGDFGHATCGEGPVDPHNCVDDGLILETFPASWDSDTFAGKIVVCEQGFFGDDFGGDKYSSYMQGMNVAAAGAIGYIAINGDRLGEEIYPMTAPRDEDNNCLFIPSGNIGMQNGNKLRNWLTSGSGHQAKITGSALRKGKYRGDILDESSSRGPLSNPDGILKPDIMAPGRNILAAYSADPESGVTDTYASLTGTSMSSPHVAGAGALIKAANPSWGPDQITSALVLTATMEQAQLNNGNPTNFHDSGAGRVQVDQAALSGLYLAVSAADFEDANPAEPTNGDPRQLNLATVTDPSCKASCEFTRRVTDSMGGGDWSVTVEGDAVISVAPSQFSLANGASRDLAISVDTSGSASLAKWNYGTVVLTNTNGDAPQVRMPVAVFGSLGELPEEILINSSYSSGSKLEPFAGLIGLQDAQFTAAGLTKPNITRAVSDRVNGFAYVESFDITADTLLLRASIVAVNPDANAEAFIIIGTDINDNGMPDYGEPFCTASNATNATGYEDTCDILLPEPGKGLVGIFSDSLNPDEDAELVASYAVFKSESSLIASGPAGLALNADGLIRVSWQNVKALVGDELSGVIVVGTDSTNPSNIGIIPVTYTRTAEDDSQDSIILGNDSPATFVLTAGTTLKRLVFDVPPGGGSVDFSLEADDPAGNSDLKLQVYRMTFSNAFDDAPFVSEMPDDLSVKGQDAGGANGPSVAVTGGALNPGRYYIAAKNTGADSIVVTARAVYQGGSARIKPRTGVWGDGAYGGTGAQGFEYAEVNGQWFAIWYTYNEDGTPTWYSIGAGALDPNGNSHTVDILEFTNNPAQNPPTQKFTVVGKATFTAISETDMKVSYILNGKYGGSSLNPLSTNTCVLQEGVPVPITGTWAPNIDIAGGIGGSSVEYGEIKSLIHFIYDDTGEPAWVISGDEVAPAAPDREAWEFRGFCPTCKFMQPTYTVIGTVSQSYSSATEGLQTLDFTLSPPNNTVFYRTMDVFRLSGDIDCR